LGILPNIRLQVISTIPDECHRFKPQNPEIHLHFPCHSFLNAVFKSRAEWIRFSHEIAVRREVANRLLRRFMLRLRVGGKVRFDFGSPTRGGSSPIRFPGWLARPGF
jgi:hypothetical protein